MTNLMNLLMKLTSSSMSSRKLTRKTKQHFTCKSIVNYPKILSETRPPVYLQPRRSVSDRRYEAVDGLPPYESLIKQSDWHRWRKGNEMHNRRRECEQTLDDPPARLLPLWYNTSIREATTSWDDDLCDWSFIAWEGETSCVRSAIRVGLQWHPRVDSRETLRPAQCVAWLESLWILQHPTENSLLSHQQQCKHRHCPDSVYGGMWLLLTHSL